MNICTNCFCGRVDSKTLSKPFALSGREFVDCPVCNGTGLPIKKRLPNIIFMACVLLIIFTTGCWNKKPDPLPTGTGTYEIPVAVERFVDSVTDADEPVEMIITVPPSDKPTPIKIGKKKRSLFQQALTNTPAHTVESDNPGVKAEQPKRSLWKRWIGFGLGAVVCGGLLVGWAWRRVRDWTIFGGGK